MSVANQEKLEKKSVAVTEVNYTICPVLVASHVAVEKGWLEEELKKIGVKLKYLWSLPHENWLAHFTHQLPNLFRDGGNIPAIWSRSRGEKTKLVGLTFSNDGGQILVSTNSGLNKVSDLKGHKIGLFQRINPDRVDFWRGTAERGILLALELAGLRKSDVEIVNLPVIAPDYPTTEPRQKPADRWGDPRANSIYQTESQALLSGRVDAIYINRGRSSILQSEGKVKAIEDLSRYPDWTLQVANSPFTISVNAELAEQHPEVVIAYLKAAVRAGRWINKNPVEAGEIFTQVTSYWGGKCIAKVLSSHNLVPSFSGKNIAGIEVEKKFLLENGYIEKDFDVNEWVDSSFLEEALKGE